MNISAKVEYACIALLELAGDYGSGEPVRIRQIAGSHGIPSRFLVQILLQLKGAGLVTSTRGAAGGYQLAKDPGEITLGEVMGIIEGQQPDPSNSSAIETPTARVLLDAWCEVASAQREMLASVTFADLVEQVRGHTEKMYYI